MTYTEIAKLAGVSEPTVSRVINGSGGVSPEKQQRVSAVLKSLGISPGPRRRRMRSKIIGLLLLEADCDAQALVGKLDVLCKSMPKKWELVLLNKRNGMQEVIAGIIRKEFDGLIIAGFGKLDDDVAHYLDRIPHIWLNSHPDTGNIRGENVTGNELAGRFGARYLLDNGCSNVAVVSGKSINPGITDRVNGFAFECFFRKVKYRQINLELDGEQCFENAPGDILEDNMKKVLKSRYFSKLDGLFFVEARLAAFFSRAKAMCCPEQPHKKLICGGSSMDFISGIYPRPAYIDLMPRMVAEMAFEKIIDRIENNDADPGLEKTVVFTPRLIPGDI